MVNPQKENGYTPISNELLEVIYSKPFNATQLKILLVICRYTYGFSRKKHSLSENFIAKAANISKRYISSELNKLIDQKVITVVSPHTDISSRVLSLNKHYDRWGCRTILPQVNNTSTGEQFINTTGEQYFTPPGEQLFHQDKQSLKQNLKQKDIRTPFEVALDDFKLFRQKSKAPMAGKAMTLILNKLEELAPSNEALKIKLLEQSIMNGWKSVYALKDDHPKGKNGKRITRAAASILDYMGDEND
jgi:phage replication O-like protein O